MKVPLSWLKEYLDIELSPEKISEVLTLAGIEVEGIEQIGSNFSNVVVAKVVSVQPHPNADKLCVAKVFDGTEEVQIVCGAKNCRAGLITALAKIGATLPPDESGKPFKIKKGKLRDVESFGMLCGADELGLAEASEGIMELSENLALGTDLKDIYADTIFDISLTPNLGHCLNIRGIARELSALLNVPMKSKQFHAEEHGPETGTLVSVVIDDTKKCFRYIAKIMQGIQVGPSPDWLKDKLESCGLRSINNVVDVSNLVMLEIGQPLHIFDLDKIEKNRIIVRSASSTTEMKTLDGINRHVPEDTLLICDPVKPLAIAGIMGGEESAVTESTKNIAIEAAVFSPQSIRKGCKNIGLKTDSSQRFERGIDPMQLPSAIHMVTALLQQVAGGTICKGCLDENVLPFIPKKINCRIDRVQRLLGLEISIREVVMLFARLDIRVVKEHANSLEVIIPSYRNDINEEIDLIEEIVRLYGYNKVPKRKPLHVSSTIMDAPMYQIENLTRDRLISEGLQEFVTCDLISPSLSDLTVEPTNKTFSSLTVLQSKSNDYSVLRSTLLGGLLTSIKHNISHQTSTIPGFEIGRIHLKQDEVVEEISCAGIVLTGKSSPHHHDPKARDVDFFDLKGIVENLFDFFKIVGVTFEISHLHNFQPGRQARMKILDQSIGVIGEVHPATLQKIGIDQRVYFAEINLHELLQLQNRDIKTKPLAMFPGSERDWTMTLKKEVSLDHIMKTISSEESRLLEKVYMLSLFESDKLGADKKNITLRFCYRDSEKTISYETVESEHSKLTQKVAFKLQDYLL
ncbi:MAG: phenylalanine--tRNA ligase subunit beta [Chlamydiae bacterium]|nr:phenylalanine--tRNA ligase subunit beta [Chlamydiota bacterium]